MPIHNVTLNPSDSAPIIKFYDGNLRIYSNATGSGGVRATHGRSTGKWYFEVVINAADAHVGVANRSQPLTSLSPTATEARVYVSGNGNKIPSNLSYGQATPVGGTISVLLNMDVGSLEFWINGTHQGIAFTDLKNLGEVYPYIHFAGNSRDVTVNFGAMPFVHPVPKGYNAYNNEVQNKFLILTESDDSIVSLTDQYLRSVKLISYSASNTYPGYQISSLFDGITTNNWTANGRISIIYTESESPFVLNSYEMFVVTTYTNRMPRDWDVYGSNDNQNWTIVDSRRSVTTWTSNESNIFNIKSTMPYKYYKFDISANNGDVYLTMAELVLYEKIDEQMVLLESKSEDIFLKNGIGMSAEIDLQKHLNTKVFNKHSFDILGSGKVFKRKIDTTKTLIKKVSIT